MTGIWRRHAWVAYLAVFFGVVGHASTEFVAKLSGVSGPELSVWRFILGGLGLILLTQFQPENRNLLAPLKSNGLQILWLSMLGVTLGYLAFHSSLDFASVPQVATVVTTIPIFVGLINLIVNKQPFTGAKIISGVFALLGVTLMITNGVIYKLAGSGESLIGILLAVACAAVVAAYSVLVKPLVAEFGALRITAVTMSIGAAGLWLLVGFIWQIWVNPLAILEKDSKAFYSLLTIGFWNTTITQFLWIGGLAAVPDITRGSYLFFLKPVIAACLGVLILGSQINVIEIVAIAVICSSILAEVLWTKNAKRWN